jgi:hypothetical protein
MKKIFLTFTLMVVTLFIGELSHANMCEDSCLSYNKIYSQFPGDAFSELIIHGHSFGNWPEVKVFVKSGTTDVILIPTDSPLEFHIGKVKAPLVNHPTVTDFELDADLTITFTAPRIGIAKVCKTNLKEPDLGAIWMVSNVSREYGIIQRAEKTVRVLEVKFLSEISIYSAKDGCPTE